ncbi:MAG: NUDIX domain-containing protein [Rhizomicrobium sp.]
MDDGDDSTAGYDPTDYDRPSVTVDLVLMSVAEQAIQALLLRREAAPAKGKWALPGGFVRMNETLDDAARRIARDKARIADCYLEQLYTFGAVRRDPRMRIITVAYFALLPRERFAPALTLAELHMPGSGPLEAVLSGHGRLELAFDHRDILALAVQRLRGKLDYSDLAFELLPHRFTLRQLQDVHEAILGVQFSKPAFRRRMLDKGGLRPTGAREAGVTYRPAELYRHIKTKS